MNKRIGYRDAVARQVESLSEVRMAVAAGLDQLDLSDFVGHIGLAGIGASYQVAMLGASYLRRRDIPATAYCPTDLYEAVGSAGSAFVALSASGQSREISEVMALRNHLPRVALCRSPGTPLAQLTGRELPFFSGADNGASSTGYTGMALAVGMLADALVGRGQSPIWAALPDMVGEVLASQVGPAAAAARILAERASIDIVGAQAGFATAGEAAMLIREAVRVPACGWDTLNYLHGPMESQDQRTGVIALGVGRETKIAQDMSEIGPAVLVTSRTDIASTDRLVVLQVPETDNEIAAAILDIVAIQMIIGDMQDAAGLTNITFRYRQTDTKLKPWSPTEV
ncbi:sugar isomerase [Devosia sp.]|uniref:SIS domain-containing protein n=1 Tax=Devosia sp. TaxID=1871048 RepID=UPI001AC20F23|nr:sugar isomerase [Devosia sp.]MBN9334545.1 sugar isomerase [Devosia sp.]